MAVYETTNHVPQVLTVIFFENGALFFFHLAQGFPSRAFRRVGVEEDRRASDVRLHMETTGVLLVRLPGVSTV